MTWTCTAGKQLVGQGARRPRMRRWTRCPGDFEPPGLPARVCFVRASRARACRQHRSCRCAIGGRYARHCLVGAPWAVAGVRHPSSRSRMASSSVQAPARDAEHPLRLLLPTVSRQALRYLDWAVDYSNPLREGRPVAPGPAGWAHSARSTVGFLTEICSRHATLAELG